MKIEHLLIALLATALLAACSQQRAKNPPLAKVGKYTITEEEFNTYLSYKRLAPKNDSHRKQLLQQYADRLALTQAITQSKILDDKKLQLELEEHRKEVLISRYFEKHLSDQISDTAIQNYYSSNSAKYQSKKAKVAHILIRTHDQMSEEARKAKYSVAHEAYSKLKSGEKFADIAKNYSEDTVSSKKGGDLGWVKQGAVDPVFSKVVFNDLAKDGISEPFHTSFGYHIVKLLEMPSIVSKPLDKVKGDIRYALRQKAKQEELKRLRSKVLVKL